MDEHGCEGSTCFQENNFGRNGAPLKETNVESPVGPSLFGFLPFSADLRLTFTTRVLVLVERKK